MTPCQKVNPLESAITITLGPRGRDTSPSQGNIEGTDMRTDAQAELALAHFEHEGPPDAYPGPVTQLASEPPGQRKAARSLLEASR